MEQQLFGTDICSPNRENSFSPRRRHMAVSCFDNKTPCHLAAATCGPRDQQRRRGDLRWRAHTQADIHICHRFYYPGGHMLILLTFAVSDGMSHTLSPRPGRREEEAAGGQEHKSFSGKKKKKRKNMAAASSSLSSSSSCIGSFSIPF